MNIIKEAGVGAAGIISAEDLALIHTQSRKELTAEEVFTFCVKLCDNEVDRDCERFPEATLRELAPLFVGKSGIFDHRWSAREQIGRIYRTELVREEQIRTAAGDPYCYLKGWVYMVRTDSNRDLIAEIEGGIKREVSVGCSVARSICSICGEDIHDRERCAHVKGRTYNGKLCWAELLDATDAYEWSFVAVPAQKEAGVIKGYRSLRALARQEPGCRAELEELEREARVGRRYLEGLRKTVVRLGGLAEPALDAPTLERITERREERELEALKSAYEERLEGLYPSGTQLRYGGVEAPERGDDMFRI